MSTAAPTGYSPAQIRQAYGFDNITFLNGAVAGDGAGTTIAIVDAYDDPTIANDLRQFDRQFGMADPMLTKVNESGARFAAGRRPQLDHGDRIGRRVGPRRCPGGQISGRGQQRFARATCLPRSTTPGRYRVVAVSMSWGGGDSLARPPIDSYFTTPAGHIGVAFVAASGDSGAPTATRPHPTSLPSAARRLSLTKAITERIGLERQRRRNQQLRVPAWLSEGIVTQSAPAAPTPTWPTIPIPHRLPGLRLVQQSAVVPLGPVGRNQRRGPPMGGLIAIVDQGLILAGQGSLDGATELLPKLYALPSSDFHDIAGGSSLGTRLRRRPATTWSPVVARPTPTLSSCAALVGATADSGSSGGSPSTPSNPGSGAISTPGFYDPATGVFNLKNSLSSGTADETLVFGNAGTNGIPLVGDWTGSGRQLGLYNPTTSTFYLKNSLSSGTADETIVFGKADAGWIPLIGDWTGSGIDTIGLYDPTTSTFRLKNTSAAERPMNFSFMAERAAGGFPWPVTGRAAVWTRSASTIRARPCSG